MGFIITNGILKKYQPDSNRSKIVIPEGVTAIKPRAFENCYQLESVLIPDTVTSIGAGAFRNCARLKDVNIPASVKIIGRYAFLNCVSLYQIAIPTSTIKIEGNAFEGCFRIWDVAVPDTRVFASLELSEVRTIIFTKDLVECDVETLKKCYMLEKVRFANGKEFSLASIDMNRFQGYMPLVDAHQIMMWLLAENFTIIPLGGRFQTVADYFLASENEGAKAFIKSNFTKTIKLLIDEKKLETIQQLAEYGGFFNKRNIDKLIEYAIDSVQKGGSLEIQLYLMDFKANQIGFVDAEKKLKL